MTDLQLISEALFGDGPEDISASELESFKTIVEGEIQKDPARPQYYRHLTEILRRLDRADEAILILSEALAKYPDETGLLEASLGSAYGRLFIQAKAAYRRALAKNPGHPGWLYALANLEHLSGRRDSCRALLREILERERAGGEIFRKRRLLAILAALCFDYEILDQVFPPMEMPPPSPAKRVFFADPNRSGGRAFLTGLNSVKAIPDLLALNFFNENFGQALLRQKGKRLSRADILKIAYALLTDEHGLFAIFSHYKRYVYEFYDILKAHECDCVFIERQDKIAQAVSSFKASASKRFNSFLPAKTILDERDYDFKVLKVFLKNSLYESQGWAAYFQHFKPQKMFFVTKEVLNANYQQVIAAAAGWILDKPVSPEDVPPPETRILRDELSLYYQERFILDLKKDGQDMAQIQKLFWDGPCSVSF